MKKFITGNHAVAEAVRLCRAQLVAAYPITPQTPIYEKLSDWEASDELGGVMMRMESEHSAMAACLSASLTGVRTLHRNIFPGAGPHARDAAFRLGIEGPGRHGMCQQDIGNAVGFLERSDRHALSARHGMDADIL